MENHDEISLCVNGCHSMTKTVFKEPDTVPHCGKCGADKTEPMRTMKAANVECPSSKNYHPSHLTCEYCAPKTSKKETTRTTSTSTTVATPDYIRGYSDGSNYEHDRCRSAHGEDFALKVKDEVRAEVLSEVERRVKTMLAAFKSHEIDKGPVGAAVMERSLGTMLEYLKNPYPKTCERCLAGDSDCCY